MNSRLIQTVAFTGHRTYRNQASDALRQTIEELCSMGFNTFLCGMAVGFDMEAADALLQIREKNPSYQIQLIAVLPYCAQSEHYNTTQKAQYNRIIEAADSVVEISTSYRKECYMMRNNFLVENSSVVVAWYDGRGRSGTHHTISRAKSLHRRIINLYPQAQTEFEF